MPELREYQYQGIEALLTPLISRGSALLADEMGLGKTAQAFTVAKTLNCTRILVVCPAVLRLNECREAAAWYPGINCFPIFEGSAPMPNPLFLPQVVVVSYDLVWRLSWILAVRWDMVIYDEAHLLKGEKSKRGKFCLGPLWERATFNLCLTGTPLPNGVADGWALFHKLAPEIFKKKYDYLFHFTVPKRNWFTGGWDFSGGRNLPELRRILKSTFMVRRTKRKVLAELPDKIYSKVFIEVSNAHAYSLSCAEAEKTRESIEAGRAAYQSSETATKRRGLGVLKISGVLEHAKIILAEKSRLVIFAHHREVIGGLLGGLVFDDTTVSVIDGQTPAKKRDEIVLKFQSEDPRRHVLIAQMQAAGVGINLTAADTCLFAELDFVPSTMAQAIDRLHRLGQKNAVSVNYVVAAGTYDEQIIDSLSQKIQSINEALR